MNWRIERRPNEILWQYDVECDGKLVCSFPVNYDSTDLDIEQRSRAEFYCGVMEDLEESGSLPATQLTSTGETSATRKEVA